MVCFVYLVIFRVWFVDFFGGFGVFLFLFLSLVVCCVVVVGCCSI